MKPMPLHEFFTSFFSVFYRTIRTAFSSSVMLARGSLSNPNATIAVLLRLKKNLELLLKLKLSLELLTNLFV